MLLKIPDGVIEVRSEICLRCQSPCEKQNSVEHRIDPCSKCPSNQWGQYGGCKRFGLGDAVAAIAQPIAKAIDSVAGTNVQGCGACKQRQEALNRLVPNL